jgi:glycerol-3-phosphate dehydrogenase
VTRDYVLELDASRRQPPLLTVYGGKITTHRRLAEAAMEKIGDYFQGRPAWTATSKLPGGEFPSQGFDEVVAEMIARWPFLSQPHARRLARAYGLRCERFLGDAQSLADLGSVLTGDLTQAELRYMVRHEWARTAEDVLWRRSKLGLTAKAEETDAITRFMASLNVVS